MNLPDRPSPEDRPKRRALELLGTLAGDLTPEGMGFAIFLFDLGPGGIFHVSRGPKAEVVASLKAWLATEEAQ